MNSIIPTYDKIIAYFFLNFNLAFDYDLKDQKALINLVRQEENYKNYFNGTYSLLPVQLRWKEWNYPVFISSKSITLTKQYIDFDIFLNSFLLLSGWQEWINDDTDLHERYKYSNSLQYKHNFISTPVVSIYFELLYELSKENGFKIHKKKFNSPFIFTHDIDQLRSGWLEDIGYELKNFSFKSLYSIPKSLTTKVFGLKDSYYKAFERMMQIEKKNKLDAISFFMTKKSAKDADYSIEKKKFKDLLLRYSKVNKIGLHPGYYTYNNELEFKYQLNLLKKNSLNVSPEIRQHFLKYNIKTTPVIHEKLGITNDYSLGFAEMFGFRNSIATPFYLFDFKNQTNYKILEIPLFFMDGTITHYMKGNMQNNINEVISVTKKIVSDFNPNFSILFHNTAFSDKKYKGFTQMYQDFISIKNNSLNNE